MRERLTALDSTFLELEDADPTAHMHIGGLMTFGPPPGGGRPDLEALRASVDERLDALPRYRMRLAPSSGNGLERPVWEPDPAFDVARHVRHAALRPGAGRDELLEWAGEELSWRLDRNAALWEIVMVDGLADGRWALLTKTHHCLVDGVGSVDAVHLLLDAEPDPAPREWRPPPPAAHHGLLAGAATAGLRLVVHPHEVGDVLRRGVALGELLAHEELHAAARTSLNRPIGVRRRLREIHVSLGDVAAVRRALGGTINDIVLTAVTGGLRALLLARGEALPVAGVRAMVPVDVRSDDEHGRLGNRVLSLFVELPVIEADPTDCLQAVRAAMDDVKASSQATGADTLLRVADLAPPAVHALFARSLFATRLFNVTVTNVPGPPRDLYALGAHLESIVPMVPLAAEHAIGIAIVSYAGALTFGVIADRDAVPDIDVVADGIADVLAQLCGRAGAGAATISR
jgi:WS/DGAT/MGAT family acyltransferase